MEMSICVSISFHLNRRYDCCVSPFYVKMWRCVAVDDYISIISTGPTLDWHKKSRELPPAFSIQIYKVSPWRKYRKVQCVNFHTTYWHSTIFVLTQIAFTRATSRERKYLPVSDDTNGKILFPPLFPSLPSLSSLTSLCWRLEEASHFSNCFAEISDQ